MLFTNYSAGKLTTVVVDHSNDFFVEVHESRVMFVFVFFGFVHSSFPFACFSKANKTTGKMKDEKRGSDSGESVWHLAEGKASRSRGNNYL